MESKNALILGRQDHHNISQALTELGYNPIVRGSVIHCYEKMKTTYISAVILESDFTHADVLEFILNVRDLDQTVPIIVLGQSCKAKHKHELIHQQQVFLCDISTQDQRLCDKVKTVMNNALKKHSNEMCVNKGH